MKREFSGYYVAQSHFYLENLEVRRTPEALMTHSSGVSWASSIVLPVDHECQGFQAKRRRAAKWPFNLLQISMVLLLLMLNSLLVRVYFTNIILKHNKCQRTECLNSGWFPCGMSRFSAFSSYVAKLTACCSPFSYMLRKWFRFKKKTSLESVPEYCLCQTLAVSFC